MTQVTRRGVVRTAAWSAPAITIAAAAPTLAASTDPTPGPAALRIEVLDPPVSADWQPQHSVPVHTASGTIAGRGSLPPSLRVTNVGGSAAVAASGTVALTVGSYADGGTRISAGDHLRLGASAGWTLSRRPAPSGSLYGFTLTAPLAAGASIALALRYSLAYAIREAWTLHVEAGIVGAATPESGADDKVGSAPAIG